MPDSPQNLLTVQQLASQVRTKYPGAYDKLDDTALVNAVTAKYPVYKQHLAPPAAPTTSPGSQPGGASEPPSRFERWMQSDPISRALGVAQKGIDYTDLPAKKVGEAFDAAQKGVEDQISSRLAGHPVAAGVASAYIQPALGASKLATTTLADPKMWPFLAEGAVEGAVRPAIQKLASGVFAGTQLPGGVKDIAQGKYAQGAQELGFGILGAMGLRGKTGANEPTPTDPLAAMYPKQTPVDSGLGPKQVAPGQVAPQQPVQTFPRYVKSPDGSYRSVVEPAGPSAGHTAPSVDSNAAVAKPENVPPPALLPQPGTAAEAPGVGAPGRGVAGGTQLGAERATRNAGTTAAPAPPSTDSIVAQGGGKHIGTQDGVVWFNDSRGSTHTLPEGELSTQKVAEIVQASNKKFEEADALKQAQAAALKPEVGKEATPLTQPFPPKGPGDVPPATTPNLPKELSGSKPRFGYQDKNFQLKFENDIDRALYTIGQKTPNKAHGQFMDFLRTQFPGATDEELIAKSGLVRNQVKGLAAKGDLASGPLQIPSITKKSEGPGGLSFLGTKAVADTLASKKEELSGKFSEAAYHLRSFLAPLQNVRPEMRDVLTKNQLGDMNRLDASVAYITNVTRDYLEKLPRDQQVKVFDNFMQGKEPPHPDSPQEVALYKFASTINEGIYKAIKEFRPQLPHVDNYLQLLYSGHTLPDGAEDLGFRGFMEKASKGKAPFEGTKALFRHKTIPDLSTAIAKGYAPYSYNMVDMLKASLHDAYKFITANRTWDTAKKMGDVQYVKSGAVAPEGYEKVSDPIAKVMLPSHEYQNMFVEGGHYVAERGLAQVLNNYLSKDYLRNNPITKTLGQSLMDIKNAQTMIELVGPYHVWTTSSHAIASELANGFNQFWNSGIRNLSGKDISEGAKAMLTSGGAPWKLKRQGSTLQALFENKNEFLETPFYKKLAAQNPEYANYVEHLTSGGAQVRMSEDFRLQTAKKLADLKEAPKTLTSLGKIGYYSLAKGLQDRTSWLFNEYIPQVKLAAAAHDFYVQGRRYAPEVAAGKISNASLARDSWNRSSNFFGEKDFTSLFWNRTMKSTMQLLYRSVTWREGNLELMGKGVAGQIEAMKAAMDHVGAILSGKKSPKTLAKALPELDPNLAYLLGSSVITAAASMIAQKTFTGKYPSSLWDLMHPQIGGKDNRGMPLRGTLPTYGSKDIPQIFNRAGQDTLSLAQRAYPAGLKDYLSGGQSTTITRLEEIAKNQDWKGDMVFNPHDPFPMQALQQAWHLFRPDTINVATFKQLAEAKGSGTTSLLQHGKNLLHGEKPELQALAMSLSGIGLAPKRNDLSLAAREALDAEVRGLPQGPKSWKEGAILENNRQLHTLIANQSPNLGQFVKTSMEQGLLTPHEFQKAVLEQSKLNYFQRMVNHLRGERMTDDLFAVMDLATPEEKAEVFPIVAKKIVMDIPKMTGEQRVMSLQKLTGYKSEISSWQSTHHSFQPLAPEVVNKVTEPSEVY